MRLVDNWRHVLRRAWSIRFILLAGLFSGLEMVVPFIDDFIALPRGVLAGIAFIAANAAFVARMIAQKRLHNDQP